MDNTLKSCKLLVNKKTLSAGVACYLHSRPSMLHASCPLWGSMSWAHFVLLFLGHRHIGGDDGFCALHLSEAIMVLKAREVQIQWISDIADSTLRKIWLTIFSGLQWVCLHAHWYPTINQNIAIFRIWYGWYKPDIPNWVWLRK